MRRLPFFTFCCMVACRGPALQPTADASPPPSSSAAVAAATANEPQCGRWTDEASASARADGGPYAVWFTIPSSDLRCESDADCVKMGGMCFSSVVNRAAAAKPEYATLPPRNPASGACAPDLRIARCSGGCCVLAR